MNLRCSYDTVVGVDLLQTLAIAAEQIAFHILHSKSDTVYDCLFKYGKVKVIPQQAEVAQGVPGRLRLRIFLTFGTTRVVGRQPYAPAAFTPGVIPGTHFQGLSRPQGTWFCRGEPRKKSLVTPSGIDPGLFKYGLYRILF